jgi:hypothetical protein
MVEPPRVRPGGVGAGGGSGVALLILSPEVFSLDLLAFLAAGGVIVALRLPT